MCSAGENITNGAKGAIEWTSPSGMNKAKMEKAPRNRQSQDVQGPKGIPKKRNASHTKYVQLEKNWNK